MAVNAVLPYEHGSLELHSAGLPMSLLLVYNIMFQICGFVITESENVGRFRAGQRRWET